MGTTSDKLTYLNDTKNLLRQGINAIGGEIETTDTFRSYVDELENIYEELPKVTGSGTSVTLDDTRKGGLRVVLNPSELEQATTTGKQMLDLKDGTYSDGGVTATVSNGEITLNGSTSTTVFLSIQLNTPLSFTNGTQYTTSANNPVANSNLKFRIDQNGTLDTGLGNINATTTITYSGERLFGTSIQIRIASGQSLTNFKIKPMVESASSVTSYEPYTGGIASPNPSYPQQIHTISGDNEIVVRNKNLFDKNAIPDKTDSASATILNTGVRITSINTGTYHFALWKIGKASKLNGKTIRISSNIIDYTDEGQIRLVSCDENGDNRTILASVGGEGLKTLIYTPSLSDDLYIAFALLSNRETTTQGLYTDYTNLILTINNEDTSYVEHKEQVKHINLGKNLLDASTIEVDTKNGITCSYDSTTQEIIFTGTCTQDNTTFNLQNEIYNITSGKTKLVAIASGSVTNYGYIELYNNNYSQELYINLVGLSTQTKTANATFEANHNFIKFNNGSVANNFKLKLMLTDSNNDTYAPYFTPIEYCEIGDYKDDFYKATDNDTGLVSGKWYIKKNIGKVVLDGSEDDWSQGTVATNYTSFFRNLSDIKEYTDTTAVPECYVNYFTPTSYSSTWGNGKMSRTTFAPLRVVFITEPTQTLQGWENWLTTHNTILYYQLSTPTYILLNDTLQTQLEDIYYTMKSYNEQTNISQVNDDLAFNMLASALESFEE